MFPIQLFPIIYIRSFSYFSQSLPRFFFWQIQTGGCCLLQNELNRNQFLNMAGSHEFVAQQKCFRFLNPTVFRHHLLNFNCFAVKEKTHSSRYGIECKMMNVDHALPSRWMESFCRLPVICKACMGGNWIFFGTQVVHDFIYFDMSFFRRFEN